MGRVESKDSSAQEFEILKNQVWREYVKAGVMLAFVLGVVSGVWVVENKLGKGEVWVVGEVGLYTGETLAKWYDPNRPEMAMWVVGDVGGDCEGGQDELGGMMNLRENIGSVGSVSPQAVNKMLSDFWRMKMKWEELRVEEMGESTGNGKVEYKQLMWLVSQSELGMVVFAEGRLNREGEVEQSHLVEVRDGIQTELVVTGSRMGPIAVGEEGEIWYSQERDEGDGWEVWRLAGEENYLEAEVGQRVAGMWRVGGEIYLAVWNLNGGQELGRVNGKGQLEEIMPGPGDYLFDMRKC